MGPMARHCGNTAIEERLQNIETHLKLPEGQGADVNVWSHLVANNIRAVDGVWSLILTQDDLFLGRSGSLERLPEAEEAGGSYPGAGGTFARVLSVHGQY